MITITFISNDGAGFASTRKINANTTIQEFFNVAMPDRNYNSYKIRVNRTPVTEDYVLQDDDRVTITPVKIAGA